MRKDLSADDEDIPPLSAPISGPGTSESEQDDAMKWLESLAQKQGAKAEELITNPAERTANAPDWVAKVDEVPAEPKPAGQGVITAKVAQEKPVDLGDDAPPGELSPLISGGPGTTSSEQDDAMKWLESLAEKQGAKAEELITNPAERTASAPDWVAKVDEAPVAPKPAGREVVTAKFTPEPPIEVGDEAPLGELSPLISGGPGTTSSEQDDAMKWLESLAEKQGAKPEELITNPAERTAAAPDWVGQVENPPTPLSAPVSGPGTTAAEHDDAMKWLESLAAGQGAKPEELITNPTERTDEPPAWVTQGSAEAAPPSSSEQDDTMAWLQSLAAGQPAPTEPTTPSAAAVASSGDDVPPQPVAPMPWEQEIPAAAPEPASDVSEWLKGLDAQEPAQPSQPAAQAPAPVVPPEPAAPPQQQVSPVQPPTIAAQPVAPQPVAPQPIPAASTDDVIPDWLKDMRDPAGPPQASQEDLPDWLKDEKSPEVGLAPMWMPADIPPASVPTSSVVKPPAPPAPAAPQQTQPAPVAAAPVTPPAAPVGPAAPSTPPVSVAASTPAPAQRVMPPPQVAAVQPPASPAPSSPARLPARDSGLIGDKDGPALQKARDLMDQKNLDLAIGEYGKLVKRGKLLEEVIYDLKAATYSHPVDVIVWQALGDAHMRANQLQEALDAYSKAEELLR